LRRNHLNRSGGRRRCENRAVRRPLLLLPLALVAALAAGCGSKKPITLAKTRACLAELPGVRVRGPRDFVASTALGGALVVLLPQNQVTIAFGLDEPEANRIAQAYRRFRGRNIGIEDVLRPERNAVLLWKAHPDPEDESAVQSCLK
jgi:hypothetical protein